MRRGSELDADGCLPGPVSATCADGDCRRALRQSGSDAVRSRVSVECRGGSGWNGVNGTRKGRLCCRESLRVVHSILSAELKYIDMPLANLNLWHDMSHRYGAACHIWCRVASMRSRSVGIGICVATRHGQLPLSVRRSRVCGPRRHDGRLRGQRRPCITLEVNPCTCLCSLARLVHRLCCTLFKMLAPASSEGRAALAAAKMTRETVHGGNLRVCVDSRSPLWAACFANDFNGFVDRLPDVGPPEVKFKRRAKDFLRCAMKSVDTLNAFKETGYCNLGMLAQAMRAQARANGQVSSVCARPAQGPVACRKRPHHDCGLRLVNAAVAEATCAVVRAALGTAGVVSFREVGCWQWVAVQHRRYACVAVRLARRLSSLQD